METAATNACYTVYRFKWKCNFNIINEEDSGKERLFKRDKNRKSRKIEVYFMVKKLTKTPQVLKVAIT